MSEPVGADLAIRARPPTRTAASLVVDGDIVNNGSAAQPVPRLRAIRRDGNGNNLEDRFIEPPVERLQRGTTAHFNATFEHPSITALQAVVTFATD